MEIKGAESKLLEELWLNGGRSERQLHERTRIGSSVIAESLERMMESGAVRSDGGEAAAGTIDESIYVISEWGKFCLIRDTDLADPKLSKFLTEQFNREPVYGAFFRQHLGEWLQDTLEALTGLIDGHYPGSLSQAIVIQFLFMCIAGDNTHEAGTLMRDREVRSFSREWLQEIRERSLLLLTILKGIESAENLWTRNPAYQ